MRVCVCVSGVWLRVSTIITVTYSVIVSVTLHVLTVDTGRIEAVALITRAFISQRGAMAPPQTHDPQVNASHSDSSVNLLTFDDDNSFLTLILLV